MVHALKEIWRVLVPDGILIDMRPVVENRDVEVVTGEQVVRAGYFDTSPISSIFIDADDAISQVVRECWFVQERKIVFDFFWYWDTVEDVQEYIEDNWAEDIIVPGGLWDEVQRLLADGGSEARVRYHDRIMIQRLARKDSR